MRKACAAHKSPIRKGLIGNLRFSHAMAQFFSFVIDGRVSPNATLSCYVRRPADTSITRAP
jgi:hypothetical protein